MLATDRLVARPWTLDEADLAAAYDIYSRPEVARWIGAPVEPAEIRAADRALGAAHDRPDVRGVGDRGADPAGAAGRQRAAAAAADGRGGRRGRLAPAPPGVGTRLRDRDRPGRGPAAPSRPGSRRSSRSSGPGNQRSSAVARRLGMEYVGRTDKYYGLHAELFRLRPGDLISRGRAAPARGQRLNGAPGATSGAPPWISLTAGPHVHQVDDRRDVATRPKQLERR